MASKEAGPRQTQQIQPPQAALTSSRSVALPTSRKATANPAARWAPLWLTVALILGWVAAASAQQKTGASQLRRAANARVLSNQPDVAAVVNGRPITRDQLAKECIRRFGKEVLESEVNKHLILQSCKANNVKITRVDVENEVREMAAKFGLSVDRWMQMLSEEQGITPQQYRNDIVWPTLALRKVVAADTQISQDELNRAFESEYGAAIQVRMIASRSADRAQKLHAAATADPDGFERLAKDRSEDENSAATRGLIPPIRRHRGDVKVERAAFALKPGEISPVINTAGQYLILRCERHLPPTKLTDAQKQQALKLLRNKLADKKLRTSASKRFAELQKEATIVNVLNDPEKQSRYPGVAAMVNGEKVTMKELGEQCVLRHGETVLDGEINRSLLSQALKARGLDVSKDDLQKEILRAAESYGFVDENNQPDANKWLAQITKESEVTVDTYVRDAVWPTVALKRLAAGNVKITEEDMQRGFRANYGERVEVLAIVLSSQRAAHEVFDLARKNNSDKFFGELAHQYSIEPLSRSNFGQVPPIRQFGGQPLLEQEAFRLKPGEISGVLAIGDKFTVLRCLGRTRPVIDDIEVVREELTKDLKEKKLRVVMAREFEALQQRAKIDNFLAGTSHAPASESAVQPVSYVAPPESATPAGPRNPMNSHQTPSQRKGSARPSAR